MARDRGGVAALPRGALQASSHPPGCARSVSAVSRLRTGPQRSRPYHECGAHKPAMPTVLPPSRRGIVLSVPGDLVGPWLKRSTPNPIDQRPDVEGPRRRRLVPGRAPPVDRHRRPPHLRRLPAPGPDRDTDRHIPGRAGAACWVTPVQTSSITAPGAACWTASQPLLAPALVR
jgi:hypothetical protein